MGNSTSLPFLPSHLSGKLIQSPLPSLAGSSRQHGGYHSHSHHRPVSVRPLSVEIIIVGCNESFQHVLKPDVLKPHCNTAKPTFISTFYSSFLVYLSCAPVTKAAKQQAPGDEEDEEAGGWDIGTESWNTQSAASAAMKLPVLTQPGLGVTTTTVTTITQTGGDWSSSLFNVCGDRTTCEADTALGLLHCIVHTQV